MNVNTPYDDLLLSAAAGHEPSEEDLKAIESPPGVDVAAFRQQARSDLADLRELRASGQNGAARRAASVLSGLYGAAFGSSGPPTPAGDPPPPDDPAALAALIRPRS